MEELFKGYVPTRNKQCTMGFKNKTSAELLNYDQVKRFKEFAGVLADDVILIDVDDYEQSEIVMKIVEDKNLLCRVYQTTRGKHFLFKRGNVERNATCRFDKNKLLAVGLECDIKVGCNNSYSVLKYDDKERPILYDILDGEEYQEVPKWLTPVTHSLNFLTMKNGSGRNQALFNYILTLQSNDFSVDEARETIRIINEYVLKQPLDASELETILRDDSFKKPIFFNKNQFLFDKFANFLKNNNHIIKMNGRLHIYKDGVYVAGEDVIQSQMIKHIPNLTYTRRREVLQYLELIVENKRKIDTSNYIAFKNGVYDIFNDKLLEFSPDIIVTNKIDFDFVQGAYHELLDNVLNKMSCHDEGIRNLLEEIAGYTFYRRNELRKSFIFVGDKANGKSTYLDLISFMLGDDNVSALDLADLGSQFKTAEIAGKLANVGDDIGDEFIKNPAIFKKLVSGDRITVERKGTHPFEFNNYAKLLFSANNIPRIKDKSGAVLSRLIIVPFNATFSKSDADYDPYIKYKLRSDESIEYFIQIGIKGLKRVLENQAFTQNEAVQRELEEYEENNNPIILFFKEYGELALMNEPTTKCYMKYKEFCISNSFTPMSQIEFSKTVKRQFKCDIEEKKIDGKRFRIFVKK